jgi:glycerophosphoryl diester phosphodiesterase
VNASAGLTVIAHRGASAHAPESTLPAVDLAVRVGADFVEVDVQMTADGRLVAIHDTTLRRTTDARLRYPHRAPWHVRNFTLAEIRTLDAGSWYDTRYAGTRVPTLREVLDTLSGRAGLLVEIKSPELYPGIGAAVVDELAAAGWLRRGPDAERVVVQSFDWDLMRQVRRLAPSLTIGVLGGRPTNQRLAEASTWAQQVNPHRARVTAAFVDAVHRHGLVTWPFTVDRPQRMRTLADLGVDGIITNRPGLLIDVRTGRTRRLSAA